MPLLPPSDQLVPMLATYVRLSTDPLTRKPVLLYPEGIQELEESAAAIINLCDGRRSIRDISLRLAEDYEAPAEEIAADAIDFLSELQGKGLVQLVSTTHGE